MRRSVALELNALNAGFYKKEASSFSATRQGFWAGWSRCFRDVMDESCPVSSLEETVTPEMASLQLRVLDVACGNLRFARFLAQELPTSQQVEYLAADNNVQLAQGFAVPAGWTLRFEENDIVAGLLGMESDCNRSVPTLAPEFADLTVCFGFLHHVPTFEARAELLARLLAATRPGGVCCISFWRFMSDPKLAAQARRTTEEGLRYLGLAPVDLDEGDYLVGWQRQPGVYRYCHSFDATETERLLTAAGGGARVLDRFCSDGRTGSLNEYLVLQKWNTCSGGESVPFGTKTPPEQVFHSSSAR